MKTMLRRITKFMGSYRMLFFLWLTLGIVTLITGNVSRITYFCVWILLLVEYLARAMDEKARENGKARTESGNSEKNGVSKEQTVPTVPTTPAERK